MAKTLTFDDCKQQADSCRECASVLNRERIPDKVEEFVSAQSSGENFNRLQELQIEISKLNDHSSKLIMTAVRLDSAAIVDALLTTDVEQASQALKCSREKSMLAVKHIKEVKDMLLILDEFIGIGAAIATSLATVPISAANILAAIQKVDNLVETQAELTDAARQDEVRQIFSTNCVQSPSPVTP